MAPESAAPLGLRDRVRQSLCRSSALFLSSYGEPLPVDATARDIRVATKIASEYGGNARQNAAVIQNRQAAGQKQHKQLLIGDVTMTEAQTIPVKGPSSHPPSSGVTLAPRASDEEQQATIDRIAVAQEKRDASGLVQYKAQAAKSDNLLMSRRTADVLVKPQWHPPWKLMRVISGHTGWVRCASVDVGNEWFVTGSADRTLKIWDLASGQLKLTLTGHIHTIRSVVISKRHPYMFSAGEDKMIKCWDLETNRVIRSYHGHLSGVHCMDLHPTIDVLVTGARDSTARVWDVRTRANVHILSGHKHTVSSVKCQAVEPQVVTGSHDFTVRCWDLAKGTTRTVLTNHKKSIRSMDIHPNEYTFVSASSDNLKKWKCPEGKFLHNFSGHNTVINSVSVNSDNVLVSAGDDGSMYFWDWKTGYNFQQMHTVAQPGSLEAETGVLGTCFDQTGTRLITCEVDKTIKIWKEDPDATPETHPIDMQKLRHQQRRQRY